MMQAKFTFLLLLAFIIGAAGQSLTISYSNDSLFINGASISGTASKAFLDSVVGQKSKIFTEKTPSYTKGGQENLTTVYSYRDLGFNFLLFSHLPGVLVLDIALHRNDNGKESRKKHFFNTFAGELYLQGVLMKEQRTQQDLANLPCPYFATYVTFGDRKDLLGGELNCGLSLIRLSFDKSENLTSIRIFHDKRE